MARVPGPVNRLFTNSPTFEDTPNAPGATHVIRYLLRNYNTYAKLERHTSLSGEVWSRSRITYEAINEQISQIWSWKVDNYHGTNSKRIVRESFS